jgi:hypothetical protein
MKRKKQTKRQHQAWWRGLTAAARGDYIERKQQEKAKRRALRVFRANSERIA